MKKLLVIIAVAMAALGSQAMNIKWSALKVYTPTVTDVKTSVTTPFAMSSGTALDGLQVTLAWIGSSGDNAIGTFTTAGGGKIASQDFGDTSGDLYKAMIVEGEDYIPTFHMTATYETADGVYKFDGTVAASKSLANIAANNITASANFSNIAGWTYTAKSTDDVPEPTSAMLLLLGAAGMALKRRRV